MTNLYKLQFQNSVEKDLRPFSFAFTTPHTLHPIPILTRLWLTRSRTAVRRLSREIVARVLQRLEELRAEPFPAQIVKLSGTEGLYRIRVGDYCVVYEVDSQAEVITVYYIRHRREVYRNL